MRARPSSPALAGGALAFLVVGGLILTSCTILVKTDAEQCVANADGAACGSEFARQVCIDDICQAAAAAPADPTLAPPAAGVAVSGRF